METYPVEDLAVGILQFSKSFGNVYFQTILIFSKIALMCVNAPSNIIIMRFYKIVWQKYFGYGKQ